MAGRRRSRPAEEPAEPKRIQRRKRRTGPRRAKSLVMCDEHVRWLEARATRELTDVAEIVMDLVDLARTRTRAVYTGDPASGGGSEAAA